LLHLPKLHLFLHPSGNRRVTDGWFGE
jgi:hypothetical protein